jgi:hypothetical protein
MGPNHDAARMCESGKRTHCTCDTCFTVLIPLLCSTMVLEVIRYASMQSM